MSNLLLQIADVKTKLETISGNEPIPLIANYLEHYRSLYSQLSLDKFYYDWENIETVYEVHLELSEGNVLYARKINTF